MGIFSLSLSLPLASVCKGRIRPKWCLLGNHHHQKKQRAKLEQAEIVEQRMSGSQVVFLCATESASQPSALAPQSVELCTVAPQLIPSFLPFLLTFSPALDLGARSLALSRFSFWYSPVAATVPNSTATVHSLFSLLNSVFLFFFFSCSCDASAVATAAAAALAGADQ